MKKYELMHALEPFTDEMEILMLAPGGFHGALGSFYGISTDGEGFLVLCLGSKRGLSLRSAAPAEKAEASNPFKALADAGERFEKTLERLGYTTPAAKSS